MAWRFLTYAAVTVKHQTEQQRRNCSFPWSGAPTSASEVQLQTGQGMNNCLEEEFCINKVDAYISKNTQYLENPFNSDHT